MQRKGKEREKGKLYYFLKPSDRADDDGDTGQTVWRGFKEKTTVHGIPHTNSAAGIVKKVFWGCITAGCIAILVYHLVSITMYYFRRDVDVSITLVTRRQLTFPAVTICNMNPVKHSVLSNSSVLRALINANSTAASPSSEYPDRLPLTLSFLKANRLMQIVADLPHATKQELGYTAEEFILDCEFAGSKCKVSEFATFYDARHGNCFVFNSGWNESLPKKVQQRTGQRYGLNMILNIGLSDYVKEIGGSGGARITVHSGDRMPFPQDEGVQAAPGANTIVGIRQMNIAREPEPYGNCTETTERNIERNVFEEIYPVNYSINGCYVTCYQKYVIARCGCGDPEFPMTGAAFDYKQVKACDSGDSLQDGCKYEVSEDYHNNRLACNCHLPCEETGYSYQTSNSMWPSEVHKEVVKEKLGSKISSLLHSVRHESDIWKNLLKVEVYFEQFNYQLIEETPSYPMVNFISDIGGILGLWVGCSIISIFEFVELFVDLTMLGVFGLLGRRDDRKTAPQDDNDVDVDDNANGGCSERKNSYTYTTPPPTYRSLQHSELTRRQQPEWQKVMAQANL